MKSSRYAEINDIQLQSDLLLQPGTWLNLEFHFSFFLKRSRAESRNSGGQTPCRPVHCPHEPVSIALFACRNQFNPESLQFSWVGSNLPADLLWRSPVLAFCSLYKRTLPWICQQWGCWWLPWLFRIFGMSRLGYCDRDVPGMMPFNSQECMFARVDEENKW